MHDHYLRPILLRRLGLKKFWNVIQVPQHLTDYNSQPLETIGAHVYPTVSTVQQNTAYTHCCILVWRVHLYSAHKGKCDISARFWLLSCDISARFWDLRDLTHARIWLVNITLMNRVDQLQESYPGMESTFVLFAASEQVIFLWTGSKWWDTARSLLETHPTS